MTTKENPPACAAQEEGKTTVLEMMVTRELGDPFRRDALSQPVRLLEWVRRYHDWKRS